MDDPDRGRSGVAALRQGQSLGGLGGAGEDHCFRARTSWELLARGKRLQFGGGLTTKINPNLSLYANADYEFAVGNTDGGKRDGIRGAVGLRYSW